jgi:predicted nucleotidyltransferase
MPGPLVLDREAIAELCRKHGARSLVVFGSAVTEHFDDSRSDVDFLVEFADNLTSRFDAYFGLKDGLEALLGRPVDLVMSGHSKTPTSPSPPSGTQSNSMQPDAAALL